MELKLESARDYVLEFTFIFEKMWTCLEQFEVNL